MKTYKEFITELNKFERFLLKQGVKAIKKLNPGQSSKSVKKSAERTVKSFRRSYKSSVESNISN